jgi:hypothetical protein
MFLRLWTDIARLKLRRIKDETLGDGTTAVDSNESPGSVKFMSCSPDQIVDDVSNPRVHNGARSVKHTDTCYQ